MPLRSMTGFAQVKGQVNAQLAFALSLKSVNHRFLDLHFRLPTDTDALEMKLRRMLKEKMARGHVEVILNLDRSGTNVVALNRQLIAGYVEAFRAAADEFGVEGEPDLNVVLRMPGAMDAGAERSGDELEGAVMARVEEALFRLNEMREEEGRSVSTELRAPAWRVWKKRRREWKPTAVPFCAATRNACSHACKNCSARKWIKNASCRKWRCWSIAATSRRSWSG
jgi:uncharacterized protein (TIGR00255 family)